MNAIVTSAGSSEYRMWPASVRTFISAMPQCLQDDSVPGISLGQTAPRRWQNIAKFREAFNLGLDCAGAMVSDDALDPPDPKIWNYALDAVRNFAGFVPTPLVTPLQLGGVSVEWHAYGIDLEIWFRSGAPPFVLIDDVRDAFPTFQGRDSHLSHAYTALKHLADRSG